VVGAICLFEDPHGFCGCGHIRILRLDIAFHANVRGFFPWWMSFLLSREGAPETAFALVFFQTFLVFFLCRCSCTVGGGDS
jgi:hypothetical protein